MTKGSDDGLIHAFISKGHCAECERRESAPSEMYICEIAHLILHPNQPYVFRVHPDCKGCQTYFGNSSEPAVTV